MKSLDPLGCWRPHSRPRCGRPGGAAPSDAAERTKKTQKRRWAVHMSAHRLHTLFTPELPHLRGLERGGVCDAPERSGYYSSSGSRDPTSRCRRLKPPGVASEPLNHLNATGPAPTTATAFGAGSVTIVTGYLVVPSVVFRWCSAPAFPSEC